MTLKPPVGPTSFLQSINEASLVDDLDAWGPRPTVIGVGSDGSYASADTVWQVVGFASNTGSGATVGVGGWGVGKHVWGGNFVGIGKTNGDVAWGLEIDAGYNGASGTGAGGGLFIVGTTGLAGGTYTGYAVRINATANSAFNSGIYFGSTQGQPVQNALILADSGVSSPFGIQLNSAHTTAAAYFTLNSGATAASSGIKLQPAGGFANLGEYIRIQGASGSSGKYGIMFSGAGAQPITNSLVSTTSALAVAVGIDFSSATFSGTEHAALWLGDQQNIQTGTTTGTKIATSASQKIGFYGAAPVAQQTGVAITAAGVHAALVTLGLITA